MKNKIKFVDCIMNGVIQDFQFLRMIFGHGLHEHYNDSTILGACTRG